MTLADPQLARVAADIMIDRYPDFGPPVPKASKAAVGPTRGLCMRHDTDYHSFLLFRKRDARFFLGPYN